MEYKLINGELEHRTVVSRFIGRFLYDEERIHHLDGNKKNNSIKNLMLFPSQKEHKSFENKVRQFGITNSIQRQIENRWTEFINKASKAIIDSEITSEEIASEMADNFLEGKK